MYYNIVDILYLKAGENMSDRKLKITMKKYQGETSVISLRLPVELVATLDEIANELYFSKTYIKNIFRKHTGTSVIQYYLDLKIEEAKKLIANNKFSFTVISDKLNFNSVHYFSRTFKQRTGISPSEYAQSIKSAPKTK